MVSSSEGNYDLIAQFLNVVVGMGLSRATTLIEARLDLTDALALASHALDMPLELVPKRLSSSSYYVLCSCRNKLQNRPSLLSALEHRQSNPNHYS